MYTMKIDILIRLKEDLLQFRFLFIWYTIWLVCFILYLPYIYIIMLIISSRFHMYIHDILKDKCTSANLYIVYFRIFECVYNIVWFNAFRLLLNKLNLKQMVTKF